MYETPSGLAYNQQHAACLAPQLSADRLSSLLTECHCSLIALILGWPSVKGMSTDCYLVKRQAFTLAGELCVALATHLSHAHACMHTDTTNESKREHLMTIGVPEDRTFALVLRSAVNFKGAGARTGLNALALLNFTCQCKNAA